MIKVMKLSMVMLATGVAFTAVHAQDVGMLPARTATVGAQRIGDLVVQGTVTPAWYVPGGVSVSVMATPVQPVPPPRGVVVNQPQQVPQDVQSVEPRRLSSVEWKQRIDSLTGDIESNQLQLKDASANLITAAETEQRTAENQVLAAQRRLEVSKKMAERVTSYVNKIRNTESTANASVGSSSQEASAKQASADTQKSVVVTPVIATKPLPTFELRLTDLSIPAALTRWAEESGYSLLWEADDEQIAYEEEYSLSFPDAVDQVIKALRLAGKDLTMCEYTNNLIRIVSRGACKINPKSMNESIQLGAKE